jgi:DNA-binding response OmpR family regulator
MRIVEKILIVEDELLIAKVLRMQLERKNFIVENIADGREVFEKTKLLQPDLIIMDMQLKNFSSGLDAAKQIREGNIQTPIIFTTGNSFDNTVKMVEGISNTKVITKPVEFEKLFSYIGSF